MNAVEIYRNIDAMRDIVWRFDINLNKNQELFVLKQAVSVLEQLICHNMRENIFHALGDEYDTWVSSLEKFQNAIKADDEFYIYDFFHSDLRQLLHKLLNILWKAHSAELEEYFWRENAQALRQRYPEILERIVRDADACDCLGIREYGIKGRVLFFKDGGYEYDMYSEYNPNEFVYQVVKKHDLKKYKKIFVWTQGGDFDPGVIYQVCGMEQTDLEVYVSSVKIFGRFLHHTFRKGMLLEERITFHFDNTLEDFMEKARMEDNVYLYIGPFSLSESEKKRIDNMLRGEQIDNNIMGEKHEKYFTY